VVSFVVCLTFAMAADPFPGTPLRQPNIKPSIESLLRSAESELGITIERNGRPELTKIVEFRSNDVWPAIDNALEPNGLTLVPTGTGNRFSLIKKTTGESRYSSSAGPFRTVIKRVTSKWDVESNAASTEVTLALHWEPRLAVFRIGGLKVKDGSADGSKTNVVGHQQAMVVKMPTKREMKTVDLSGSVIVTVAEKRLRFAFEQLGPKTEKTQHGVTVTLSRFERKDDLVEADVAVVYPPGMPTFESFEEECWLRDNVARVISPDRTKRFESNDLQTRTTPSGATITYRFPFDAKKGLTPGAGWTLEIETPSALREYAVPFSLTGIPLP
jgi:hypothetical protein